MEYNHKLSEKIQFNTSEIPKEKFIEFLDNLFQVNRKEYANEMKDGFLDLFNYWSELGYSRFIKKLNSNLLKQ